MLRVGEWIRLYLCLLRQGLAMPQQLQLIRRMIRRVHNLSSMDFSHCHKKLVSLDEPMGKFIHIGFSQSDGALLVKFFDYRGVIGRNKVVEHF